MLLTVLQRKQEKVAIVEKTVLEVHSSPAIIIFWCKLSF